MIGNYFGRFANAEVAMNEAAASSMISLQISDAIKLGKDGEYVAAIKKLNYVIEKDRNNLLAHLTAARIQREMGNYIAAGSRLRKLRLLYPNSGAIVQEIGNVYIAMGKEMVESEKYSEALEYNKKALKCYKSAVGTDVAAGAKENVIVALLILGKSCLRNGDGLASGKYFDEAEASLIKYQDSIPHGVLFQLKGEMLFYKGEYDSAREFYLSAYADDSTSDRNKNHCRNMITKINTEECAGNVIKATDMLTAQLAVQLVKRFNNRDNIRH